MAPRFARRYPTVSGPVTVNETALRSTEAQGMMGGQENVLHLAVGLNAE
ncbi:MAG: hypothetical protein ACHWZW_13245 [Spirulina sp.]